MRITDFPKLDKTDYPRADALKQELRALVDYAEIHNTSAEALNTWFTTASGTVSAALTAAIPADPVP